MLEHQDRLLCDRVPRYLLAAWLTDEVDECAQEGTAREELGRNGVMEPVAAKSRRASSIIGPSMDQALKRLGSLPSRT